MKSLDLSSLIKQSESAKLSGMFSELEMRDLAVFVTYITNQNFTEGKNVYALAYNHTDSNEPLMCHTTIKFQCIGSKEGGVGATFIYAIYRAKNFSCSNINVKQIA